MQTYPYNANRQNLLRCSVKQIDYSFSAVKAVSSKPSVKSLPRIKISFFLSSISTNELISAPYIITFLPNPQPFDNKKILPRSLNPIPHP